MAEPMDIDSDFDNKENSLHHNNVLPFTEKGYEELDVSELNMKLRYSITPASSPMSKSYTANCVDNRGVELGDDTINATINENSNLTRSLNSNLTKNDSVVKSLKALPLQSISTEQFSDSNRSTSVLRPLDTTITEDNANVTVTVCGPSDNDENLSLLSSSSSAVPTPEATTPTKDNLKNDGGSSPIMRGIKSVLNMFRSSQSPIPPTESGDIVNPDILSPSEATLSAEDAKSLAMLASTPISSHRKKEASPTKRNSPHKESIVFNDDLEKELQWKDETTIIFSQERIPIHKLFFQQPQTEIKNANQDVALPTQEIQDDLNSTVEYMDISCNDSFRDRTMTDIQNKTDCTFTGESDTEFVDCETTFTKNESLLEDQDKTPVNDNTKDLDLTKDIETTSKNTSGSRLKQIILNTTQDILDATLSITPEDLLPEALFQIQGKLLQDNTVMKQIPQTENTVGMSSEIAFEKYNESIDSKVFVETQDTSITSQEDLLLLNQTVDIANQYMDKIGESNVTTTFENVIQPVLDQTVDIKNQSMDKIEESNVTATFENVIQPVLDQTVDIKNQSVDKIGESNLTATFENVIQPVLDQTVDITNQSVDNIGKSNVTETFENVIQPVLDQTVDITNQPMNKIGESNVTVTFESVIQPVLDQTVDITNQSMDKLEESNVTETFKNVIQPVFDQTVEIINSETNTEDEPNVTQLLEKISSRTVTFDSQHNILDSTPIINETQIIEDLRRLTTNHYDEPSIDTTNVGEHNSSTLAETINIIHNPDTLEEIVNKSLLNPDNGEESSPKEASMTELAAEIPLPDEDDLDKELNTPVDETDTSTLPISLPPDLVDNINVQTEIDMIINLSLEKAKQIMEVEQNSENNTGLPQPPILNTSNSGSGDNLQNEIVTLDSEVIGSVPEVIKDTCVDENPPLTEEPQVVTVDVFPEAVQSLNTDTELKIDQAYEFEVMNQTGTVTERPTDNCEKIKRLSQPMDINESVIGLKPLPDIINQTNIVPNVENIESSPDMIEPVTLEQTTMLPENLENVTNAGINPEIVPESVDNVVPELLSDVSEITKPEDDLTKVVREELPFTPASDEIAKNSVTHGTTAIVPEDVLLTTNNVTDTKLYVEVIPTEHVNANNEKQPANTNTPVSGSADIKTEDDEIILSENNSPFVSVIAENIASEQNIDVQNIDHRLATAGKVVFTPPASPPIASKGYNFNFDEMDDPFATKTKIRVSPDTPTKAVEPLTSSKSVEKPVPKKEMINRRKSQPERKKPVAPKNKFKSTFSGSVSHKRDDSSLEAFAVSDITLAARHIGVSEINTIIDNSSKNFEDELIQEAKNVHEITLHVAKEVHKLEEELHKPEIVQPAITSSAEIETDESATSFYKDSKSVSSSDQSAYYTAGTSSNESFHSRNVFNIPEIDDKNFNPFATKSKMRKSPPPSLDIENPFAINSKMRNSTDSPIISPQTDEIVKAQDVTKTALPDDKMETELMEKDGSGNLSNITTSSKATDEKNATIKEVNTEDEDTIEGPFLEAEDLNADDKMSDFDGENIDMMQFNDLPTQGNDENGDNGELFIDAEAFEFLLNQNKNTVIDSGKESLFLKFDPLFAKRISSISSESLVASLNKFQKRQSTPTKAAMPEKGIKSPIAGPSNLNTTQEMDISHNISEEFNEELNITVSKPMMVVPPAVNPVTPRNKSLTPNRSNRRSLTFTSPAMAVIDRLLSLSGNSSLLHDTTVTHATREQNEADLALTQLRELLAEKEISVYSLRSESKELKDRLTSLECHLKSLEDESQDRLKKINGLNERLAEKTKINKGMAAVVEEYERTIASLISEIAQDKKRHAEERIKLINERDEQTAHLASMEVSFSDLHSKYEKSKQVILNCKANEDAYKKSIKEFEENLIKMQSNYELLKQHATSKLNHANQELEKMNKSHEAEVLKLNAMMKRKDLHITSLEESLAQKTKANEELTAICDELINKVG